MRKLSDFVRIEPKRSSLEVTCNINTQHVSKLYYEFIVDLPTAILEPAYENVEAVMPKPQINFNVCPICMVGFMTDAHSAIQKMQILQ